MKIVHVLVQGASIRAEFDGTSGPGLRQRQGKSNCDRWVRDLIRSGDIQPARLIDQRRNPRDDGLRDAIVDVLELLHPPEVRQIYYTIVSTLEWNDLPKTEATVKRINRLTVDMRLEGGIPWQRIVDRTRKGVVPFFDDHIGSCILTNYRSDPWEDYMLHVQVRCESRSITSNIGDECDRYGVGLFAAAGHPSWSLAWEVVQTYRAACGDVPRDLHVVRFGYHDPDGRSRDLDSRHDTHAPRFSLAAASTRRILVTEEQIERLELPTKPLKETTLAKAAKLGITRTAEADAVPVDEMRRCLREELERLLPPELLVEAGARDRRSICWSAFRVWRSTATWRRWSTTAKARGTSATGVGSDRLPS